MTYDQPIRKIAMFFFILELPITFKLYSRCSYVKQLDSLLHDINITETLDHKPSNVGADLHRLRLAFTFCHQPLYMKCSS